MKLDLSQYVNNKPFIKTLIDKSKDDDIVNTICNIAVATHVPVLAVCYYTAEIIGMRPEIQDQIYRIIDFYKYDEIIGVKELNL